MDTPTPPFDLSLVDMLHDYSDHQHANKDWGGHDRLDTVGASEAFACMRRVAYDKAQIPRDDDYEEARGAMDRGNVIEEHWIVPALRYALPAGLTLHDAGSSQNTRVAGWLSCTPDGIVVNDSDEEVMLDGVTVLPGCALLVEMKTVDPRVDLTEARMQHKGQVQVQAGIVRWSTNWKIVGAILMYVNASFLDDITIFPIEIDNDIYDVAATRAEAVFSTMAIDEADGTEGVAIEKHIKPEGKMAGGKECAYCPWIRRCQGANVARVPENVIEVTPDLMSRAAELVDDERGGYLAKKDAEMRHGAAQQKIKDFLHDNSTNGVTGPGWSIRWSTVKPRVSYDYKAMEADGIDLTKYEKPGNPSERLLVKGAVE